MISMGQRVLLIEPYQAVAETLALCLESLDYRVVLANCQSLRHDAFTDGGFDVVFINLDQGDETWASAGLELATEASRAGLSVVMIPDGPQAKNVLQTHNWVYLHKPFTVDNLENAIRRAGGARRPALDRVLH